MGVRGAATLGVFAVSVVLTAAALATTGRDHLDAQASAKLDVELAFDTTNSMAPSIAHARAEAQKLVGSIGDLVADARFAVVSFRDFQNPGGEYEVLQPLTAEAAAVNAAVQKLHTVRNTAPSNVDAESYNLAFRRSYTGSDLGWRADSRKIVVVIGDAEPYGAGTSVPGCADTTPDPHGLRTADELAGMRAARRTLVLIRQAETATASLACYQALAARAYAGGGAVDSTSATLSATATALVRGAVVPLKVVPALPIVLPGRAATFTVTLTNPNAFPLAVSTLRLILPRSLAYQAPVGAAPAPTVAGNVLTWPAPSQVATGSTYSVAVTAVARASGAATAVATADVQLGDQKTETAKAQATVRITRRLGVQVVFRRGRDLIRGSALLTLPATARSLATAGRVAGGSVTARRGAGPRLTLRPLTYRLVVAPDRATATLRVRVAGATPKAACPTGATGTVVLTDRGFGGSGDNRDTARVQVPRACGGGWTWSGSGVTIAGR